MIIMSLSLLSHIHPFKQQQKQSGSNIKNEKDIKMIYSNSRLKLGDHWLRLILPRSK